MTFEELVHLTRKVQINVTINQITRAFGYWKMNIHDIVKDHQDYFKLTFCEFLEYIGRIALLQNQSKFKYWIQL